jgi:hypothetical protein
MSTAYSAASVIIPAQGGGGKADTLYGWRPDVNQLQDIDVQRNTTASRVNEAGLIEFVGVNVPRFDWGEGGSCPKLLVEPERMNLVTYSEEFDDASWLKVNSTATANASISPDGTSSADRITSTVIGQFRVVKTISSISANTDYQVSAYFKNSSTDVVSIGYRSNTEFDRVVFNLLTETIDLSVSGTRFISGKIENVGNNWYRCSALLNVAVIEATSQLFFTGGNGFSGSLGDSFDIWGAQLEEGSNATSYIKTEANQVTRNADVISKTGIASLIGQSEGTLFVEVDIPVEGNNTRIVFQISDGTGINKMDIRLFTSKLTAVADGGNLPRITITNPTNNFGINKAAITYQSGNLSFFVNGVKVNESLAFTTFSSVVDQLNIGDDRANNPVVSFDGNYKQLAIYKTALTHQEAIALTTL